MISIKIQRIFVILAIVGMAGMISFQTISADKMMDRTRVEFTPHSFYSENESDNIASPQNMTSNKNVWEEEMGNDMPQGVYRGPLFEPNKMKLNYKPRWRNEYHHDSNESIGTYGYTNLVQSVRISSNKIMNGASEFWMQVPVDKDCLYEFNAISKGADGNEYFSKTYSSVQIFKGDIQVDNLNTFLSRTVSTINAPLVEDNGRVYPQNYISPEMYAPITPDDYYGQRPYVKINGVFESNTNYTIVYNLLTKDNKPQIYTTSSENFGKVDIQYWKETIDDMTPYADPTTGVMYENLSKYPVQEEIIREKYSQRLEFDIFNRTSELESTDIRLATSFIFTSGIGESYLFGEKISVNKGDVLQFYPDVNWTKHNEIDKNYLSFYMPFISEDNLGKEDVGINISYANSIQYDDNCLQIPGEINWTYSDYILFTFPKNYSDGVVNDFVNSSDYYRYNVTPVTGVLNVSQSTIQIRFRKKTTLTLLCHGKNYGYDKNIPQIQNIKQHRFHNSKFTKIDTSSAIDKKNIEDGRRYYHNRTDSHKPHFYYPYIRPRLSEGVWMQINSTSNSKEAYTHAFGVSEYYSNITVGMVDEENRWIVLNVNQGSANEGEKEGGFWSDDVGKYVAWGLGGPVGGFIYNLYMGEGSSSDDDLIGKIWGALKTTANAVFEGLETIYGYIVDGLKFLWKGIKKVFSMIYTKLMEFVGWIKGIAEDIAEIGGTIAMRIAMMGGFLMFMGVATAVSKFIQVSDWNMMEGQ